MKGISNRQQAVLEFMQKSFRRTGEAPTYREIAAHIRRDVRAAYQHVIALEKKGVLERTGGSIRLLGDYYVPKGLPILGRVAAGKPIMAVDNLEGHIDFAAKMNADDTFVLQVRGDSMVDAGIQDGDMVVARSQPDVESGDIAVIIIDEEATVKRVRLQGRKMILEPANRKYEPQAYDRDDESVRIAGKVLMAVRQF